MTMFGTVLLIDDNPHDNFIHKSVLEMNDAVQNVIEFIYAEEAIDYLQETERPKIDLIFVDINMPRMDGWEFVDAFDALEPDLKSDTRLVMVSGSSDPDDRKRAEQNPVISAFLRKPLTEQVLEHLYMFKNVPPPPPTY